MFGTQAMIKIGFKKFADFIKSNSKKENGYCMEFTENEINNWLAENGHEFSILCLDDVDKGKVLKIIYSGE